MPSHETNTTNTNDEGSYVDTHYTTTTDPKQDLARYDIYDVLGFPALKDGPNPGIDPNTKLPYLNIDDPNWGTELYPDSAEKKWSTDPLNLGLPKIEEKPKTCEDACILKTKKRHEACKSLRARVKEALDRAGCPCDIQGRDKPSPCSGAGSSGNRVRYNRRKRSAKRKPAKYSRRSRR